MDLFDYTFYCDSYLGSAIAQSEFAPYAKRAQAHLNADTFGRAENVPATDTQTLLAIKLCLCAMADVLYAQRDVANEGALVKESVGSWSRTYATNATSPLAQLAKVERLYLGSTGLLYRGGERIAE